MHAAPIERLVNLLDPEANLLLNMSVDEALRRLGSGNPDAVREIDGQFALLHKGREDDPHGPIDRPSHAVLHRQAAGRAVPDRRRAD